MSEQAKDIKFDFSGVEPWCTVCRSWHPVPLAHKTGVIDRYNDERLTALATLYTATFTLSTEELLRLSHFVKWCEGKQQ